MGTLSRANIVRSVTGTKASNKRAFGGQKRGVNVAHATLGADAASQWLGSCPSGNPDAQQPPVGPLPFGRSDREVVPVYGLKPSCSSSPWSRCSETVLLAPERSA